MPPSVLTLGAAKTPSGTIWPLADRILEGRLRQHLADWRGSGSSFDSIAAKLGEHNVKVTGETVRRWAKELGIE